MRHHRDRRTGDLFSRGEKMRVLSHMLARSDDPDTSKAAACATQHFAGQHRLIVLRSLLEEGSGTFYEVASRTGLTTQQVWKRLSDLETAGLARKTGEQRIGDSGRKCSVWEAVT